MKFSRYKTHDIDPGTGRDKGVIAVICEILRKKLVTEYEEAQIRRHLDWLDLNLPKPEKFSRTRNDYHKNTHGLSWLKPTSKEALEHLRALASILEEHGIPTTMITTEKPGFVVYEDDYQVVAEPFGSGDQ